VPLRALLRAAVAPLRGIRTLWRARRSLPYRFERARIRARHGPVRRGGVPCAAGVLYVVSFLYVFADVEPGGRAHAVLLPCAGAVLVVLLLGGLMGACIAGARAFGGERAVGTFDALVMLPVPRDELVLGRLLARSRPQRRLFLVYFASTLAVTVLVQLEDYSRADWWCESFCFTLMSFATLGLFYFSMTTLGAGLGLLLGLRVRSSGAALATTLAVVLVLAAGEFIGANYWFDHIISTIDVSGPRIPGWGVGVLRVLAEHFIFMFGFVASVFMNFIASLVLVVFCVRRFDRWAMDK